MLLAPLVRRIGRDSAPPSVHSGPATFFERDMVTNMEAMHALLLSLPLVATTGLVFAFGASGLLQLAGPGFVLRAYQRWALPPRFHRVIGALMVLVAIFLAVPNTRLWGVALAGLVNFFAVVTLLKNREYGWALPGLAVAIALPVMLVITLRNT